MCRCGDQYFVAVSLSDAFKIGTDGAQTGILTGSTGIGLQAYSGKSGDDFQLFTQVVNQFAVSGRLILRNKRVHAHKLSTAQR